MDARGSMRNTADTLVGWAFLLGLVAACGWLAVLVARHPAWVAWLVGAVVATVLCAVCTLWAVVRYAEVRLTARFDELVDARGARDAT